MYLWIHLKRVPFIVAVASILSMLGARPARSQVIVWGVDSNTPGWNEALHVVGTREGCSSPPEACVRYAARIAHTYRTKVFLAVSLATLATGANAVEYSRLSVSSPFLAEVGTDDFVSQYRRFAGSAGQPSSALERVIDELKSVNPKLNFGLTLYEDEIEHPYLHEPWVTAKFRSGVDYVHLYVHYRANGPAYQTYVQQAHALFPSARIIAGSYAYDRITYIPCSRTTKAPCSPQQEMDLYKSLVDQQASLLRNGQIDSIEFIPGFFGRESQWPGWNDARNCAPERRQQCIENTIAQRQAALSILVSHGVASPLSR